MEMKSALYENLTANPSLKNVEAFHQCTKEVKKEIFKIKKESFMEFCESLDTSKNPRKVWNILREFKRRRTESYYPPSDNDMDRIWQRWRSIGLWVILITSQIYHQVCYTLDMQTFFFSRKEMIIYFPEKPQ